MHGRGEVAVVLASVSAGADLVSVMAARMLRLEPDGSWLHVKERLQSCQWGSAQASGVNPAAELPMPAATASVDIVFLAEVPLWSSLQPHFFVSWYPGESL